MHTLVQVSFTLARGDPLEEGMAAHSSVLAWRIPWGRELRVRGGAGSQVWTVGAPPVVLGSPPRERDQILAVDLMGRIPIGGVSWCHWERRHFRLRGRALDPDLEDSGSRASSAA